MKTLDEVIKGVEAYVKLFEEKGCFDCHYREDDCVKSCFLQDELHYLKEYKDLKSAIDWHEEMEEIRRSLTNDHLTWEELRTMQDKPVWWVHGEVGEWLTIYSVPKNDNNVIYATTCSGFECWIYKKDMDKYNYYKKELK